MTTPAHRRPHPVSHLAVLAAATAAIVAALLAPSPSRGAGADTLPYPVWRHVVDPTALPLGDGHVSLSAPAVGSTYSCSTGRPVGPNAPTSTPWIHGTTWDPAEKPAVEGRVLWSAARHTVSVIGATRVVTTNDLPHGEPTGIFPIAPSDPAYAYDHNPNSIIAQSLTYRLPLHSRAAPRPSCLPKGPIGVLSDGVVLFDALDASNRDAVAHEIQDLCNGHPDGSDMYHYHDVSSCLLAHAHGPATVVGFALDGYPIVVERDAQGRLPGDADLDACHGRVSTIVLDGRRVRTYHYDATLEYPYVMGCFHGTPVATAHHGHGPGPTGPPTRP